MRIHRQLLSRGKFDHLTLVTFSQATPFALCARQWSGIIADELTRLVGTAVDVGCGDGYVPRPPEPEDEPRWRVIWAVRFPRPHPFRVDACMPAGIGWELDALNVLVCPDDGI